MSSSIKQWRQGTHRLCPPAETLARARRAFRPAGITRLADVTRLDDLGIPTFQCVRPGARTLSVSQGKGVTPDLARVSAAMEALELWHAEEIDLPVTSASAAAMGQLGYEPSLLARPAESVLHDEMELEWVPARGLMSGTPTFIPLQFVHLDSSTTPKGRELPVFEQTSNGLASGNSLEEACLHGLYEVIERHCATRQFLSNDPLWRLVRLETVTGPDCRELIRRMQRSSERFEIFDMTDEMDVPAFAVVMQSHILPCPVLGYGCHLDKEVALSRALTEAAQSRLTAIAGARDDVSAEAYGQPHDAPSDSDQIALPVADFESISDHAGDDLESDLADVAERVRQASGHEPIVVDLTKPRIGIPVVRVVCPGLLFDARVI